MKKPLLKKAVLPLLLALFPACGQSFTTSGEPSGAGGKTTTSAGGSGGESASASAGGGGNDTGGTTTVQQCSEADKCTGGKTCQDGVCLCPGGLDDCNGTCVDTDSDVGHCGDCGTQCVATCAQGVCNDPIDVAAGGETTCAVLEKGEVYCWGSNNAGQLGGGVGGVPTGTPTKIALTIPAGDVVRRVFVGKDDTNHVCALTAGKKLYCWGSNADGKLGLGDDDDGPHLPALVNVSNVDSVALGARHSCVTALGKLICWGANDLQQQGVVGDGSSSPQIVVGQTYGSVSAGFDHTCGTAGTMLKCWGRNDKGQLGIAGLDSPQPPTIVPGVSGPKVVAAGEEHTCALESSGFLKCWGSNAQGQLGTGVDFGEWPPTTVSMVPGAPGSIAAGRVHAGALIGGETWFWGRNEEAEVSDSGDPAPVLTPKKLEGLVNIDRIALGWFHSCALSQDHSIYCWGHNGTGQLGNGAIEAVNLAPGGVKFPAVN